MPVARLTNATDSTANRSSAARRVTSSYMTAIVDGSTDIG